MEIGITYEESMIGYRRNMKTDGQRLTYIPHAYLVVYIIVLFPHKSENASSVSSISNSAHNFVIILGRYISYFIIPDTCSV